VALHLATYWNWGCEIDSDILGRRSLWQLARECPAQRLKCPVLPGARPMIFCQIRLALTLDNKPVAPGKYIDELQILFGSNSEM
jgi:hypothetical protein